MLKAIWIVVFLFSSGCSFSSIDEKLSSEQSDNKPYTFVIVHGATGGGWDWKTVAELLSGKGHTVYRPTLSGLGEKYHLASANINLTTHIDDIVNLILFEELTDVVLVGHSYGGMVITGVMDRIPERLRHVTFLDAKVPADGMSMADERPLGNEHKVMDSKIYFSWLNKNASFPRDMPHPYNTYIEAVSYKNPLAKKLNVTYVAFIPEGQSMTMRKKDPSWQRAEQRHWTIRTFDGDHVIYRKKPIEFSAMLEQTVKDKNHDISK